MGNLDLAGEVGRRIREGLEKTWVVEGVGDLFWRMAQEVGIGLEEETAFRDSVRGLLEEMQTDGPYTLPGERGLSDRGEAVLFLLLDLGARSSLGGTASRSDDGRLDGMVAELTRNLTDGDRETLRRLWREEELAEYGCAAGPGQWQG